jgi:hypothetical protein
MSVEKYLFWYRIQEVFVNIDKLEDYREKIYYENFSFVNNLNSNIEHFDILLKTI